MSIKLLVLFSILLFSLNAQEYDNFADIAITSSCQLQSSFFTCNPNTRYSQFDGSCNNLEKPWYGKAFLPFKRYLPPVYDDFTNAPRVRAKSGRLLPNPRMLSLIYSKDVQNYDYTYTHLLPIFGQFLAHDLTHSSATQGTF